MENHFPPLAVFRVKQESLTKKLFIVGPARFTL